MRGPRRRARKLVRRTEGLHAERERGLPSSFLRRPRVPIDFVAMAIHMRPCRFEAAKSAPAA